MNKIILITFVLIGCKHEPEFYINGKPYYTHDVCIESHYESNYEWHYGYNLLTAKYEYHYGLLTENICDKYRTDTIEIK